MAISSRARHRRAVGASAIIALALTGLASVLQAGTAAATTPDASLQPAAGQYVPVPAVKVVDTRSGIGTSSSGPLASGGSITYSILGQGAVPYSGVSAAYIAVTAINPTVSGCLVDYPSTSSNPGLCNTSFEVGQSTTDTDIVATSTDGAGDITVTNQSSGSTDVAVTVLGYFTDDTSNTAGSTYVPQTEQAVLDTREGLGAPEAKIAAGGSVTLTVAGEDGVPADAAGVGVYLGAADASTSGYLSAYASNQTNPGYSLLSYAAGEVNRDFVFSALSPSGQITITNQGSAAVDVILDLAGWLVSPTASEPGTTFSAVAPSRILDTRNTSALAAGASLTFSATGVGSVPTSATAVAESVAALNPVDAGYLSVYASNTTDPNQPVVNFAAGDNQDNDLSTGLITNVGANGQETVTNHSSGTVNVVISTRGYFTAATDPQPPSVVTSTYSSGTATVTWNPPISDGGAAIEGYIVTLGSGATQTVTSGSNQAQISASSTGTVTVTAYNSVGQGVASTSVPVNGGDSMTATPTSSFTGWTTVALADAPAPDPDNGDEGGNTMAAQAATADLNSGASVDNGWKNGAGCGGFYTGTNPKDMQCRDSSITVNNTQVPIRYGFWNGATGFGWSKAYYYHNLEMQPIIDTIRLCAKPKGSLSNRDYEVYFLENGITLETVNVVADVTDDSWAGNPTPDGQILGVLTGYCNGKGGSYQLVCPDWVNKSL